MIINEKTGNVFYDETLIKRGASYIDWKKSIGLDFKIKYDNIMFYFKIHDVILEKHSRIILEYNKNIFPPISICQLKKCGIGRIVKNTYIKIDNNNFKCFKFNVGDMIDDLIISENKIIDGKKYYKYKCLKCGFNCGGHYRNVEFKSEHWIAEGNLKKGCRCSCCAGRIVAPKINSIWTTDPWMIDLGVSIEDAKKYTKSSSKKITVICPHCSKNKNISVDRIYQYKSISCSCGDGKSYPEKFMMGFINQLNLNYETEYTPIWSNGRRYDFYINFKNSIIETHGSQHPKTKHHDSKGFYGYGSVSRTTQQELENDIYKEQLAKENGIENYIVIDCSKSEMEFIKNEILNSRLAELYDLSNINWLECERFALKNIAKEVCDYWNQKEEWETVTDIASVFNINRITARRYIKCGSNLKWCNYSPENENIKTRLLNHKNNCRKVEVFKDGISLGIFDSATQLEKKSEEIFGVLLNAKCINQICLGKNKQHKGYTFKRVAS